MNSSDIEKRPNGDWVCLGNCGWRLKTTCTDMSVLLGLHNEAFPRCNRNVGAGSTNAMDEDLEEEEAEDEEAEEEQTDEEDVEEPSSEDAPEAPIADIVDTPVAIVLSANRQNIDGFGGCSAWQGALSDWAINSLFGNSTNQQLGLSIIRLRIDPNMKNWGYELSNAQKAAAQDAIVMASPWSAPARMKTNNKVVGGSLLPGSYADYAEYLKSFAIYLAENGVSLYVISVQNEPDVQVSHESMEWTPDQMVAFLKGYRSLIGNTLVMAAESHQFHREITDAILNDGGAVSQVDIIGGHIYGGGLAQYQLAFNQGKPVWMTEHCATGNDWDNMMILAKEIHDCLTKANFNAYINGSFVNNADSTAGLLEGSGNPTSSGYIIGQWAKYVRPGYQRVVATYSPSNNVYVSAFKGDGKVVIVAVNTGGSAVNQQFSISGGAVPGSFSPHITSQSKKISEEASVDVFEGAFIYSLAAQSVTTFVSN